MPCQRNSPRVGDRDAERRHFLLLVVVVVGALDLDEAELTPARAPAAARGARRADARVSEHPEASPPARARTRLLRAIQYLTPSSVSPQPTTTSACVYLYDFVPSMSWYLKTPPR